MFSNHTFRSEEQCHYDSLTARSLILVMTLFFLKQVTLDSFSILIYYRAQKSHFMSCENFLPV